MAWGMREIRSILFVPGDRPDRMEKALAGPADAIIVDLEDAVAPAARPEARLLAAGFIAAAARDKPIVVRVNPLDSGLIDDDLAAVLGARPDAIMLPKSLDGGSVAALAAKLDKAGADGVGILPIVSETPAAIFGCGTYKGSSERLVGMTWGAEDLPAAIGASASRFPDGSFTPVYEVVRTLALMGAHAAGVQAIDTVYPAFRDLDGLRACAGRGRRDGFTGMMAIHPAQVEIINSVYSPGEEELDRARRIVALFAANPGAGALAMDGGMVDAPHLKAARRLLARAGERADGDG